MATIRYKGKDVELKLSNRTLMKYEMNGGSFAKYEEEPVSQSVKLVCAALDLDGDPLDHADDLPPLTELAEVMKEALDDSGQKTGGTDAIKKSGMK